jgi:hypothetical protein
VNGARPSGATERSGSARWSERTGPGAGAMVRTPVPCTDPRSRRPRITASARHRRMHAVDCPSAIIFCLRRAIASQNCARIRRPLFTGFPLPESRSETACTVDGTHSIGISERAALPARPDLTLRGRAAYRRMRAPPRLPNGAVETFAPSHWLKPVGTFPGPCPYRGRQASVTRSRLHHPDQAVRLAHD